MAVCLELYNSLGPEDRRIWNETLKKYNSEKRLLFPGTMTVQELKNELLSNAPDKNARLVLVCERFVPNPNDTLGDLLSTLSVSKDTELKF